MSNAVFPSLPGLTWNVVKSPLWSTKVQQAVGGKELRAQFFSTPIYTWQLTYELLRANALLELQSLVGFFNARQGRFDSFLFSDPDDNNVTSHGFGAGDGATTAFQLQRTRLGFRRYSSWEGIDFAVATMPRTNLIAFSEDLTGWAPNTGVTISAPGSLAPDLTASARLVTYDGSGVAGDFRLLSSIEAVSVNGQQYSVSCWLRSDQPISLDLSLNIGALQPISVTSQWQRFTFSVAGNGVGSTQALLRSVAGDNSAFAVYLWGVQVEKAAASTAYIKTTGTAVTAKPAYWPAGGDGFEPVKDLSLAPAISRSDWQGLQALFPTARANLCLFSEQIDNAACIKGTGVTIAANATTAPDGSLTADRVSYSGAGVVNANRAFQGIVSPSVNNRIYTFSAWLRADAAVTIRLSGNIGAFQTINVTTGWQRFSFQATGNGVSDVQFLLYSALGDNSAIAFYFWGAQVEVAAAATSYIPTTTTAATVTDYTLSSSGVVTLAVAPLLNAALIWTGSFYWRVRFNDDVEDFNNFLSQLWEAKQVKLVSVKAA